MAVPNSEYKENWEELHAHHTGELERLSQLREQLNAQIRELRDAGHNYTTSPEMQDLERQIGDLEPQSEHHLHEMQNCLSRYQHITVQDAAEWVFANFNPDGITRSSGIIHDIDFDSFQTIDEVSAAWSAAHDASEQGEAEKRLSLPVGHINDTDVFQDLGDSSIASQWQEFDNAELGIRYAFTDTPIRALVTIHQIDDEYYICFMDDPNPANGAPSVMNEIERLANAMYRRALSAEDQKAQSSAASGFGLDIVEKAIQGLRERSPLAERVMAGFAGATRFGQDNKIPPENFHFFIHVRPIPHRREIFWGVDMSYEESGFQKADFHRYEIIPEVIQNAHRSAQTVSVDVVADAMEVRRLEGPQQV